MQCNICDEEKPSIVCVCPDCWDKYEAAFDEMLAAMQQAYDSIEAQEVTDDGVLVAGLILYKAIAHAKAVLKKGGTTDNAVLRAKLTKAVKIIRTLLPCPLTGNPTDEKLVEFWQSEHEQGRGEAQTVLTAYRFLAALAREKK